VDDARHLVRFDTDRIKDYVFATDRLREIEGRGSTSGGASGTHRHGRTRLSRRSIRGPTRRLARDGGSCGKLGSLLSRPAALASVGVAAAAWCRSRPQMNWMVKGDTALGALDFEKKFLRLLDRISEPEAVVPFLGAGVSRCSRTTRHPRFKPTIESMRARMVRRLRKHLSSDSENLCFSVLAEVLGWEIGHADVLATVKIEYFTQLAPLAAHVYIAYLAREGVLHRVITTNWDTCVEQAYAGTFFRDQEQDADWDVFKSECKPAAPLAVISDLDAYRLKSGRRRHGRRPTFTVIKINGCAGRYLDDKVKNRKAAERTKAAERIRLTDRQLQQFWNESWARDLLVNVARNRNLLFSGFGSDEPQVRHTILQLVAEFHETDLADPNAPFLQAYESTPSFNQEQVLRGFLGKCWAANAFTGRDRPALEPDGKGTRKLPADRFWQRVFQAVFGRLLAGQIEAGEPFGAWVRNAVALAPGELLTSMVAWYYPPITRSSGPSEVFESFFGRFHRLLEPPVGHDRNLESFRYTRGTSEEHRDRAAMPRNRRKPGAYELPLILSAWLASMSGRSLDWAQPSQPGSDLKAIRGAHPYLPIREDPLQVCGLLLVLYLLFRNCKDELHRALELGVRPTRFGLGVKLDSHNLYLVTSAWQAPELDELPPEPDELETDCPLLLVHLVIPSMGSLRDRDRCSRRQERAGALPELIPGQIIRFDLFVLLQDPAFDEGDLLKEWHGHAARLRTPSRKAQLRQLNALGEQL